MEFQVQLTPLVLIEKSLKKNVKQRQFELCRCEYYDPQEYRTKIFELIAQEIDTAINNDESDTMTNIFALSRV